MAWPLKGRLALVCVVLLVAAIATAVGQDALRRLPPVSGDSSEPGRPGVCQRLPPVRELPAPEAVAPARTNARLQRLPRVTDIDEVSFEAAPESSTSIARPAVIVETESPEGPPLKPLAQEGGVWWETPARGPLRADSRTQQVDVDALVLWALMHSAQVRAISENYLIQRTAITEAAAEFDPRTYMDTRLVRTNEPVGNTLTTGGPPRYMNDDFRASAGVRKKFGAGGTLDFSQRFGMQTSNSVFFLPQNQGNSRLSLSFSQPLLKGAGKAYNSSVTVLAEIDTSLAENQTALELQEHLLRVTKAYWELYLQRAVLLQKQRVYDRGKEIEAELDSRRDIDALQNQLVRARAAVSTRRSELIRAEASIKNAEARIRALINAPDMLSDTRLELIPIESPARDYINLDLETARTTALQNRPEIDQAMKQIQAANVRLNASKNELRPALDLVLDSYISGLQGQFDFVDSFAEQFSEGAPSFTAGLVYERPWNNRAARARLQRRQLELRKVTELFQASLQQLSAEVEVSVREVQTSYAEMQSKRQAMAALQTEMEYLTDRWQLLPGDDRSASFLLGDLLDVQEQLAREEFAFAKAQTDYALALAELKRVTGTLLQYARITVREDESDCLPTLVFDRQPREEAPPPVEVAPPEEIEKPKPKLPSPILSARRTAKAPVKK